MKIQKLNISHVPHIQILAHTTWPITFADILSSDQIAYMLDMMYSTTSLSQQMSQGVHFGGIFEEEILIGFIAFEPDLEKIKIHKLYILPDHQGKKIGSMLIDYAENFAFQSSAVVLTLNVNKYNTAVEFYKKIGFAIVRSENIEIGNGYLMEDFVMERHLKRNNFPS